MLLLAEMVLARCDGSVRHFFQWGDLKPSFITRLIIRLGQNRRTNQCRAEQNLIIAKIFRPPEFDVTQTSAYFSTGQVDLRTAPIWLLVRRDAN